MSATSNFQQLANFIWSVADLLRGPYPPCTPRHRSPCFAPATRPGFAGWCKSLKTLHLLSIVLLFGSGLGSAFYKWMADRSGYVAHIAATNRHVVLADWIFTPRRP